MSSFMQLVNILSINEFIDDAILVGFDVTGCNPTLNIISMNSCAHLLTLCFIRSMLKSPQT